VGDCNAATEDTATARGAELAFRSGRNPSSVVTAPKKLSERLVSGGSPPAFATMASIRPSDRRVTPSTKAARPSTVVKSATTSGPCRSQAMTRPPSSSDVPVNYHDRVVHPAIGLILAEGTAVLVTLASEDPSKIYADEYRAYSGRHLSTLADDLPGLAIKKVSDLVLGGEIAVDIAANQDSSGRMNLVSVLTSMRRTKAPDEVELIHAAFRATEAGYAAVAPIIRPGLSEIELFSRFHAGAVIAAGNQSANSAATFAAEHRGGPPRQEPLAINAPPAWTSIVPQVVSNAELPSAATLSGLQIQHLGNHRSGVRWFLDPVGWSQFCLCSKCYIEDS
jgi:hypothetical protein